jgi:hypothetical protein
MRELGVVEWLMTSSKRYLVKACSFNSQKGCLRQRFFFYKKKHHAAQHTQIFLLKGNWNLTDTFCHLILQ